MDIVLLGPPGSGKGTQARLMLEGNKDLVHLSTGDLLRSEVKNKTPLGEEIKSLIDRGELISDVLISTLVRHWAHNNSARAMLFDGFPRTESQVIDFVEFEKNSARDFLVIELIVHNSNIIDRLARRCVCAVCGYIDQSVSIAGEDSNWVCPSCGSDEVVVRSDDRSEVVSERLATYNHEIISIRSRFDMLGAVRCEVDGSQSIQEVKNAIAQAVAQNKVNGRE